MVAMFATPALAKPAVVQALQVGEETVRYQQGIATLDLHKARGAVQITPLPMDHGSLAFTLAVLNSGDAPPNFDITNVTAPPEVKRAQDPAPPAAKTDQITSKGNLLTRFTA